jgi:lipopolysaccharide/colanic/teichoic acid biosynthesis glycosyltransferase
MTKRLFDFALAAVLLVILLAPMLVIACFVFLFLGRPVFFEQSRAGLQGVEFKIYKFRSMLPELGVDGRRRPDVDRLNSFGRFLRRTSLDELPSLWNVLKGEMSLVGPRPLLIEYLPLYSSSQARRHEVLPGITGLAQVNGRNALTWEKKFELDVWYVDNWSFLLDVKILLRTVRKVVVPEGISAQGEATMPRFTGSGSD